MTDTGKKALEKFAQVIPRCTEAEKEKILNWGEAIANFIDFREQKAKEQKSA